METARETSVEIAIEPLATKDDQQRTRVLGGGLSCYLNPLLFLEESHLLFILC